jgi:signal transduction histidine kinase
MKLRTLPLLGSVFGTLLALILLTSASVFVKSSELQERFAQAERRYHQAASLLVGVRTDIYASMFTVQQYLLSPSNESRARARDELTKIRRSSETHLSQLEARFPSSPDVSELKDELARHWRSLDDALNPMRGKESYSGGLSEGTEAVSEALQVTRNMDEINTGNLNEEQRELERSRRSFGHFLLWITLLTVSVGAAVSIVSLARLRRFERENEWERQKTQLAEFELRRLSQQLLKVQEEERKNISRELHDEVGQLLTGLRIELGNLHRSDGNSEIFENRMQEAKGLAETALRTVRNMAMLLRPSMLDDQGLGPALRWQAKEFSRRFEIPVNVQIEGNVEQVPGGHGVCLYRVVQEVLTNCAKHAQAKHVSVSVKATDAQLSATIEDDGIGFQSREQGSGIGLLGIAERVREFRGTFFIDSQPGIGTRIDVELPIGKV